MNDEQSIKDISERLDRLIAATVSAHGGGLGSSSG